MPKTPSQTLIGKKPAVLEIATGCIRKLEYRLAILDSARRQKRCAQHAERPGSATRAALLHTAARGGARHARAAAMRLCATRTAMEVRPQRFTPPPRAAALPAPRRRRRRRALRRRTFAGQWAAVVTEFDASGAASTKNVDRYAAHLRREGYVGVFVCGTSGESMSLSVGERERLAEAWAASGARHGLRVIVHVGCDALLDAERLAGHAAALGVAGVAAMAPRFVKCDERRRPGGVLRRCGARLLRRRRSSTTTSRWPRASPRSRRSSCARRSRGSRPSRA